MHFYSDSFQTIEPMLSTRMDQHRYTIGNAR